MAMDRYWHCVTESVFPWEEDAFEFVRRRLPDSDRYRVWSNFELVARDGRTVEAVRDWRPPAKGKGRRKRS